MARGRIPRHFYISWVAVVNDPWPDWRTLAPGRENLTKRGQPITFRPDDDNGWPTVPEIDTESGPRIHTGPTLPALFHPNSEFHNLKDLDQVYLLWQEGNTNSPHELLEQAIHRIAAARGILDEVKAKVRFVPIQGIVDPTAHEDILSALEKWVNSDADPTKKRMNRANFHRHININLSPGTPAMHMSWLLLYWNGAFDDRRAAATVNLWQGDGGTGAPVKAAEQDRKPLVHFAIDKLARFKMLPASSSDTPEDVENHVDLGALQSRAYKELQNLIEQAAIHGLKVLLEGERGTGKTFLAQFYHDRRQTYRQKRRRLPQGRSKCGDEADRGRAAESDQPGKFVVVTLSEYSDNEYLRSQLFGWAKGAHTGADESFVGLLGKADGGTLFLDEIHRLPRALQTTLLGPLNDGEYQPSGNLPRQYSDFDLVVATNDPAWRDKLEPDFRDRIERIVLEVPSFRMLSSMPHGINDINSFWQFVMRERCSEAHIKYSDPPANCAARLQSLFERGHLPGNWRDLKRLAEHLMLFLDEIQPGCPLEWEIGKLDQAIEVTFSR